MVSIQLELFYQSQGQIDFEQQLFADTASPIWIYTENENLKIKVMINI